jgi:HEAT repeat protein
MFQRAILNGLRSQPQIQGQLKGLAKDDSKWVRSAAAIALVNRKDDVAIPILLELTKTDWPLRAYQIEALGNFPNDSKAVEAIKEALNDPDPLTRQFAENAWRKVPASPAK